jgi:hypothetical protein
MNEEYKRFRARRPKILKKEQSRKKALDIKNNESEITE